MIRWHDDRELTQLGMISIASVLSFPDGDCGNAVWWAQEEQYSWCPIMYVERRGKIENFRSLSDDNWFDNIVMLPGYDTCASFFPWYATPIGTIGVDVKWLGPMLSLMEIPINYLSHRIWNFLQYWKNRILTNDVDPKCVGTAANSLLIPQWGILWPGPGPDPVLGPKYWPFLWVIIKCQSCDHVSSKTKIGSVKVMTETRNNGSFTPCVVAKHLASFVDRCVLWGGPADGTTHAMCLCSRAVDCCVRPLEKSEVFAFALPVIIIRTSSTT